MGMELIELERRLIGFDTVSRNSNLEMAEFLEGYLGGLGLRVELYPSEDGQKANLLATLGPSDVGGLMLAGHMDVVPVEGQAWDADPFTLRAEDGRYYGRGTADMKSFIAQAIHAVEQLPRDSLKLPVHLAFTYDEEVGCGGAERLMTLLREREHVLPKCAVIGEPTGFQVFRLHKGITIAQVSITGVEGHSGKPELGVNATYPAVRIIDKLIEVEAERKRHRSMEEYFQFPYTTVNVGMINGGTAVNIIPNRCEIAFEYRTMPTEDTMYVYRQLEGYISEVLRPELKQRDERADVELRILNRLMPMELPAGSEIERIALELTGHSEATAAPYYTEGAIYNEAGIPTVICGPGDIDQAHRPNEFITREQMEQGVPFLAGLIAKVCGP
ncbi:MAG: acetylornithine deacetylase [SAR324 cluster bacterium]|nr:acetylornithine deacetylase [SAR324 cluster bacterium]